SCGGTLEAILKRKTASLDEPLIFEYSHGKLTQTLVTPSKSSPENRTSVAAPGTTANGETRFTRGVTASEAKAKKRNSARRTRRMSKSANHAVDRLAIGDEHGPVAHRAHFGVRFDAEQVKHRRGQIIRADGVL